MIVFKYKSNPFSAGLRLHPLTEPTDWVKGVEVVGEKKVGKRKGKWRKRLGGKRWANSVLPNFENVPSPPVTTACQ